VHKRDNEPELGDGLLRVVGAGALFDGHVFEFACFKDLGAFETLDEFRVGVASDYTHAWMLTGLVHADSLA
jgi:hypothetical protein